MDVREQRQSKPDWYVIYERDHRGPYLWSDLIELRENKQLDDETLVWSAGLRNPTPFRQQVETPPPLPETRGESFEQQRSGEAQANIPPIPLDAFSAERKGAHSQAFSTSQKKIKNSRASLSFKAIVVGLFFVLAPIVLFSTVVLWSSTATRPKELSLKDYERLQNVMRRFYSKLSFAPAIGRKQQSFFIGTNAIGDADVELSLKSIDGEVAVLSPITLRGRGKLQDGLISVYDPFVLSGEKFHAGRYRFEINRVSPNEGTFFGLLPELPQKIVFEAYVGALSPSAYQKEILQFRSQQLKIENRLEQQLVEKTQTLLSVTSSIKKDLEKLFSDENPSKKKSKQFEKKYANNYGQFLTTYLLKQKSWKRPEGLRNQKQDYFRGKIDELAELARTLAKTSMDYLGHYDRLLFQASDGQSTSRAEFSKSLEKDYREIQSRLSSLLGELEH